MTLNNDNGNDNNNNRTCLWAFILLRLAVSVPPSLPGQGNLQSGAGPQLFLPSS